MKSLVTVGAVTHTHTHTHTDTSREKIARNSKAFNIPKNKRIYTRTIVLS